MKLRRARPPMQAAGLLLVLAAAVTLPTVRRAVGQASRAGSTQMSVTSERVIPGPVADAEPQPMRTSPMFVRQAQFARMEAVAEGGVVAISGQAQILDRVPGIVYVWLLRLYTYERQPKLLSEHHYLENAVVFPGGTGNPEFSDTIRLAPGTYRAELTLYAVPPGFRFDQFQRGEDVRTKAIITTRWSKKVVVGG